MKPLVSLGSGTISRGDPRPCSPSAVSSFVPIEAAAIWASGSSCFALRWPGRLLKPGDLVPEDVLKFTGAQLGMAGDALLTYAAQRQTSPSGAGRIVS